MHRIVILEGPDGAGKTTLAHLLVRELNATVHHFGPPSPGQDLLQLYHSHLHDAVHHSTGVVVFDRLYAGEHIYGPVGRDNDRLGKHGFTALNKYCNQHNVLQVLCLPPYEIAEKNYELKILEKDDYLKSMHKFKEVYWRYKALEHYMDRTYDYTAQEEPFSTLWLIGA